MLVYLGSSSKWILNVPWYNTIICSQLHGSSPEDYVTTARKYRYNLMFSTEAHGRMHPTVNDDASSGGGIPMPPESTLYVLVSLVLTLNFIVSWIQ